jgi:hypothetical protein
LGLHVDATIPAGQIGILAGAISASSQFFSVDIRTDAEHERAAKTDIVALAVRLADSLYQLVRRTGDDPVLIKIGAIRTSTNRGFSLCAWL